MLTQKMNLYTKQVGRGCDMKDLLQEFIDKTAKDAEDLYLQDKCECQESIEMFVNAVIDFFKKDRPEMECKVIEYDEDYDKPIDVITNLLDESKDYCLDDYYTAEMNGVYFWILLLDKRK